MVEALGVLLMVVLPKGDGELGWKLRGDYFRRWLAAAVLDMGLDQEGGGDGGVLGELVIVGHDGGHDSVCMGGCRRGGDRELDH